MPLRLYSIYDRIWYCNKVISSDIEALSMIIEYKAMLRVWYKLIQQVKIFITDDSNDHHG